MRTAENHGGLRAALTGVVLVHLAVVFWHWSTLEHVRVPLSALQTAFVTLVLLVLPGVGVELLWTRRTRKAAWVLLVSMFASLVFSFVTRFMLSSPDHVVTAQARSHAFVLSAAALVVTETVGTFLAAVAVHRWRRTVDAGTRGEADERASAHRGAARFLV